MASDQAQADPELLKSFAAYDQQVTISNIQLGCWIGMALMPAGFVLDWMVYKEHLRLFLALRVLCSGLIGLFLLFVRSEVGRRHYRQLGITLAMFPTFFIALMIYLSEGQQSPYYAGLNLVLLVVGYILHWTLRESAVAFGLVLLMYLSACVLNENHELLLKFGGNNLYFLILTGIIIIWGSHYHSKRRFSEFALRYELDKKRGEIEETNRKLKELDEVKSRFFANISHELRTPLTLLLAPLDAIARDRKALPRQTQDMLATMQANGMRLLKLINDLLDLVRLDSGRMTVKREPLDIEAFVGGLVQAVKRVADDKRLHLRSRVDHEVGTVMADMDKLEKIILNLVFNAIKFTPAGGTVELTVEKKEDQLILQVRDTGMGMSKESLANVFRRFWQADTSSHRKFQGAGIGLALVKELVEVQEGTVHVQSEVQKGTTITLTFPYIKAEPLPETKVEPKPPVPGEPPEKTSEEWLATLYRRAELFPSMVPVQDSLRPVEMLNRNGKPSVLVADDEPDMLRFLKSQLMDSYQVIEAVDGNQAGEKAAQFLPDIILLDMMMPEKDGLQVCRELRAKTSTKRIPVILLTARADEETKLTALDAGASDFLPKPFSSTELHVRIKNLIDSHEYQRKLTRQNQILEATLQQLKETESQLVQSEKLASLGRMSAGIIHEINNPLNFAKTAIHMLKIQGKLLPDAERDEFADTLKDIEEGIDRVRTIVSDLRSFTHPNTENFEEVYIRHIVSAALRFLSHEWKQKVTIEQDYDENQVVIGNRHQLIQVMLNLLQNSLDALKKKEFQGEQPRIVIRGVPDGDRFKLLVRDNGPGIAAEHLGKVFDPFFTTKDVGEGMGLGLSICYRILETHRGRIEARSEVGEYCEFALNFPLHQPKEDLS